MFEIGFFKNSLDYLFYRGEWDEFFSEGGSGEDGSENLSRNSEVVSFYEIKSFLQLKTSAFYRIGLNTKIPPLRVVIRNFED